MPNGAIGIIRKMDAKGRISLPASLLDKYGLDKFRVTVSPNKKCVYIFEEKKFDDWVLSLFNKFENGYDPNSEEHTQIRAALMFRGLFVDLDGNKRIAIPAEQRKEAGLASEVAVFANGDHIEVWDKERWDAIYNNIDLSGLVS
ncbi:MAG: division/cell wall cluster transcriptional repressor MraZ [Eggerthellaceae bacterium]|nr:division/cell wall cluster transcriptional repressor MraZ [Eggerthellaceae bacterium]